jgi:hypothetical protein
MRARETAKQCQTEEKTLSLGFHALELTTVAEKSKEKEKIPSVNRTQTGEKSKVGNECVRVRIGGNMVSTIDSNSKVIEQKRSTNRRISMGGLRTAR